MFIGQTRGLVKLAAQRIENQMASSKKLQGVHYKATDAGKPPKMEYIKSNLALTKDQKDAYTIQKEKAGIRAASSKRMQEIVEEDGGLGANVELEAEEPDDGRTVTERVADQQFVDSEADRLAQELFKGSEQAVVFIELLSPAERVAYVAIAGELKDRFGKRNAKLLLADDVYKAFLRLKQAYDLQGTTTQQVIEVAPSTAAPPTGQGPLRPNDFSKPMGQFLKIKTLAKQEQALLGRIKKFIQTLQPTTTYTDKQLLEEFIIIVTQYDNEVQAAKVTDRLSVVHSEFLRQINTVLYLSQIAAPIRATWRYAALKQYLLTPVIQAHMQIVSNLAAKLP